ARGRRSAKRSHGAPCRRVGRRRDRRLGRKGDEMTAAVGLPTNTMPRARESGFFPPGTHDEERFAGPIVIRDGFAVLTVLDADPPPPKPEPPEVREDPPWGARLVVCAKNFRACPPAPAPRALTARPQNRPDSPAWNRTATALLRWATGRAPLS